MSDAATIDATTTAPRRTEAYLVVRSGSSTRTLDLRPEESVTFGRGDDATVCIDDPKASRLHARVQRSGDQIWLEDLGSRNGVSVGGTVLKGGRSLVRSGDVFWIGDTEVLVAFHVRGEPAERAQAVVPRNDGVVAADRAMVEVFELATRAASTSTTVLILGETGVGKEVIAEHIHRASPRAGRPFVRLNCGSIAPTLLESELFGHERGAFTGADRRVIGLIESADTGTLFLDEVGELPLPLQAKLLRVLETRAFMRVGGREEIHVDVRFVAATNRDLAAELKASASSAPFRSDLYFRLAAFTLRVPPLRERPLEIALLAELFVRSFCARDGRAAPPLTEEALSALERYEWPGNVRELRNAIEGALILADASGLRPEHFPAALREDTAAPPAEVGSIRGKVNDAERRAIEEALRAEGGNQTRAARRLGIARRTLLYKLRKHGL